LLAALFAQKDDGPQRLQRGLKRCQWGEPSAEKRSHEQSTCIDGFIFEVVPAGLLGLFTALSFLGLLTTINPEGLVKLLLG